MPYSFLTPASVISAMAAARGSLRNMSTIMPFYHVGGNYVSGGPPTPDAFRAIGDAR